MHHVSPSFRPFYYLTNERNEPSVCSSGPGGNDGDGGGGGTRPDGTPSWHKRNNVSDYCWTHGACAHDGSACKNKKPGHKDEATFANKMGGSIVYCKS